MKKNHFMLAMLVLLLPFRASAQYRGSGGDGTQENPFLISTVNDLIQLGHWTSYLGEQFEGVYFEMTNDITYDRSAGYAIGGSISPFQGHFDGKGYRIKNFQCTIDAQLFIPGLFGTLGEQSEVKHLTLEAPVVTCSIIYSAPLILRTNGLVEDCHVTGATLTIDGGSSGAIGGLAGLLGADGVMRDCTFSGTVNASAPFGGIVGDSRGLVERCASHATVNSTAHMLGGIAALNIGGTIQDCCFDGRLASQHDCYTGGLVGQDGSGTITRCYNTGVVVTDGFGGGLAGRTGHMSGSDALTSLTDCYNVGRVTDRHWELGEAITEYSNRDRVGGLVGLLGGADVERCWNGGTVRGSRVTGGLVGEVENGSLTDCYNAGLVQCTTSGNAGGIAGFIALNSQSAFTRVLSYGTLYNAPAGRNTWCEIATGNTQLCTLTDVYYDAQTTGWNVGTPGGLSTAALTGGTLPEGFAADVWTADAGGYPRLAATGGTAAAVACSAPLCLTQGENHGSVTTDFTLAGSEQVTWTLESASLATLDGRTVHVTPAAEPDVLCLAATADGAGRQCMVTVEGHLFTGEGTEQDPYSINDYDDLCRLARAFNELNIDYAGRHFAITADIAVPDGATLPCIATEATVPFNATLDGRGHTISNWLTPAGGENQALFVHISPAGTVRNLTVDTSCTLASKAAVAAFAVDMAGRLENCRNLARVSATAGQAAGIACRVTGTVTGCYNGGDVAARSDYQGGIAAENHGTIEDCLNTGDIGTDDTGMPAGGIAGCSWGTVADCLNTGTVRGAGKVGGIAGNAASSAAMAGVVSLGVVEGNEGDIGAIAGYVHPDATCRTAVYDSQVVIYNTATNAGITGMATAELTGYAPEGVRWQARPGRYPTLTRFADEARAIPAAYPVTFAQGDTRLTMTGTATLASADGLQWTLLQGSQFAIDGNELRCTADDHATDVLVATCGGYSRLLPIAATGGFLAGSGTDDDPWLISTPADLLLVSDQQATSHMDYQGRTFSIVADLDMDGQPFTPIAGGSDVFAATLLGNGHTISNLVIRGDDSDNVGLIGHLSADGRVTGLTIGSGEITGASNVGAIAGQCKGVIEDCANHASVTATGGNAGGLVGSATGAQLNRLANYGDIRATGDNAGGIAGLVSGTAATYTAMANHGDIAGNKAVGGVIGSDTGASLADAANTGTVTATQSAGGIVGSANAVAFITGAVNDGTVTATNFAGGIAGSQANNADFAAAIEHSLNTGDVTATAKAAGGIVGEADTPAITGCASTGTVANTNAALAVTEAGAGGIVGIGLPTIDHCLAAGTVSAINNVGGLLGYPERNRDYSVANSIVTAAVSGYGTDAANVGAVVGKRVSKASLTNLAYDSQMSPIEAMAGTANAAVKALATTDIMTYTPSTAADTLWIVTESHYPRLKAFTGHAAANVALLPAIFAEGDTRLHVTAPIELSQADGCVWTFDTDGFFLPGDLNADGTIDIDDVNAVISTILTGNYNQVHDVNGDGRIDIDDLNAVVNDILFPADDLRIYPQPGVSGDFSITVTIGVRSHSRICTIAAD